MITESELSEIEDNDWFGLTPDEIMRIEESRIKEKGEQNYTMLKWAISKLKEGGGK